MPPVGDYLLMFTTGILGSAHCVGMCGGFVLMYSMELSGATTTAEVSVASSAAPAAAHLLYNAGRILTYSLVGGFMGYAGSFVDAAGRIRGVQGSALLVAGVFMVVMGLNLMGVIGRPDMIESAAVSESGLFRRAFRRLLRIKSPLAVFPLGLMLGLVPCGLSYTMEIKAASSGGFWQGFTLMSAFGLGTAPALAGLGFVSAALAARLRQRIYRAAAALVTLMGVQALLRGMAFNGWIPHGPLW